MEKHGKTLEGKGFIVTYVTRYSVVSLFVPLLLHLQPRGSKHSSGSQRLGLLLFLVYCVLKVYFGLLHTLADMTDGTYRAIISFNSLLEDVSVMLERMLLLVIQRFGQR